MPTLESETQPEASTTRNGIASPSSQLLYSPQQHPQAPLLHLVGLAPKQPCQIALYAQRHVAPTPRLLETVLEPTGVFPLPGGDLGAIDDPVRDAAHGGAVHAERALGHAGLELVQEGDAAVGVVDVDAHPLWRDLRVPLELGRERVVVRGEEADAANVSRNMVQDGLSDGDAVAIGL